MEAHNSVWTAALPKANSKSAKTVGRHQQITSVGNLDEMIRNIKKPEREAAATASLSGFFR